MFLSGSGGTGKSHYTQRHIKQIVFTVKAQKNQELFYLDLQEYQR